MFKHCSQKFKPYETWFLYDNKGFYERSLIIGKCPVCKKPVAELKEKRKADDKTFYQLAVGKEKVERLTGICINSVNYSSQDLKTKKSKMTLPKYIRYGENKFIKKGGKTFQRMNAVGRYGQREVIQDIPVNVNEQVKITVDDKKYEI